MRFSYLCINASAMILTFSNIRTTNEMRAFNLEKKNSHHARERECHLLLQFKRGILYAHNTLKLVKTVAVSIDNFVNMVPLWIVSPFYHSALFFLIFFCYCSCLCQHLFIIYWHTLHFCHHFMDCCWLRFCFRLNLLIVMWHTSACINRLVLHCLRRTHNVSTNLWKILCKNPKLMTVMRDQPQLINVPYQRNHCLITFLIVNEPHGFPTIGLYHSIYTMLILNLMRFSFQLLIPFESTKY